MPESPSGFAKEDTLKSVEKQINHLTASWKSHKGVARFYDELEKNYLSYRSRTFFFAERKVMLGALLIYLAFGLADFFLIGETWFDYFRFRLVLAGVALAGLYYLPKPLLRRYLYTVLLMINLGGGISLIIFTSYLEGVARYAFHLGMLPVQVLLMVSLRLSFRGFVCSSGLLFSLFCLMVLPGDRAVTSELGQVMWSYVPYYLGFWLSLIMLGCYLTFILEEDCRNNYMRNRLLVLEAELLQLMTKKLEYLSITDQLTQLSNRRHFEHVLEKEWFRCLRAQQPISLILLDVDYFKQYNDNYGHASGDECLRQVAAAMKRSCNRSADLCARYGGEEFVILLPGVTAQDAFEMADKVLANIQRLAIAHAHSRHQVVTCSAGVVGQTPEITDSYEEFIRRADDLLYRAKDEGRNRALLA